MRCTKPFNLKGLMVPCGKCIGCRILLTAEWTERIKSEIDLRQDKLNNWFITLTYDDEHLPVDGKLKKIDLLNFLRRLKYEYSKISGRDVCDKENKKFAYYAVGEYGDRTQRPHFHIILIGFPLVIRRSPGMRKGFLSEEISSLWSYGHHLVGGVSTKSINYVTGYVRKKAKGLHSFGASESFAVFSRGIGRIYFEEKWHELLRRVKGEVYGDRKIIPRYYKKFIKENYPDVYERYIVQKVIDRTNDTIDSDYKGSYDNYCRAEDSDALRRSADDRWFEENIKRGVL